MPKSKFKFTVPQLLSKLKDNGITATRQRLYQLIKGYTDKSKSGGKEYEYKYKPIIKKGEHWKWDEGEIKVTQSGFTKLKKHFQKQ